MSERKMIEAAIAALREHRDALENLVAERQDYWEQRTDRWQDSDAGELHGGKTQLLEDAVTSLESALDVLEEASQ